MIILALFLSHAVSDQVRKDNANSLFFILKIILFVLPLLSTIFLLLLCHKENVVNIRRDLILTRQWRTALSLLPTSTDHSDQHLHLIFNLSPSLLLQDLDNIVQKKIILSLLRLDSSMLNRSMDMDRRSSLLWIDRKHLDIFFLATLLSCTLCRQAANVDDSETRVQRTSTKCLL